MLLLLCAAFVCAGKIAGQNQQRDSLLQVLQTQPRDTQRVKTLVRLGIAEQNEMYQAANQHFIEALQLARELNFSRGIALASIARAELLTTLRAGSEAMLLAQEAYDLFAETRDSVSMARCCVCMGIVNEDMNQFSEACTMYQKAYFLYKAGGNERFALVARHNLGSSLSAIGDTARALSIYRQNLQELDSTMQGIRAAAYNNIGNLMPRYAQQDSALYFFHKALDIKVNVTRQPYSIANTLINIAESMLLLRHMDSARLYLDSALVYARKAGAADLEMDYHDLMAEWYHLQNRDAEAYAHTREILVLRDTLDVRSQRERTQQLDAVFQAKEKQSQIELLSKQAEVDGAERRLLWIVVLALLALTGFVVVGYIITVRRSRERRRVNILLQRQNAEIERNKAEILHQNQQLASQNHLLEELNQEKDGLIGIVAHDLRAPLNRALALADLVRAAGQLSPEQETYLDLLRKTGSEGAELIQNLLELNQYENDASLVRLATIHLERAVQNIVAAYMPQAGAKQIALTADLPDVRTDIRTDEKLLGRSLDNLISNAIKFTPHGKNIRITLEHRADAVGVAVQDEGPGISAADQAIMFRKFQRLSARPTGGETSTGLGLSIVKTLADRLNARLEVRSELGQGTTMILWLPRI